MIIFEALEIVGKTIWVTLVAFFKAFIQLSELNSFKERIIAAGLGIPIRLFAVISLIVTTITISTKIIRKIKK